MTFVKICGITNIEDALAAVDAGADSLGFNFYRRSPRFVTALDARRIIERLPATTLTVGVFVNEVEPTDVVRIADQAGVRAVQLHGDEPPDYCAALSDRYVIKALRVNSSFAAANIADYNVDAVMLDGFDANLRGGTGRVFDWAIAREVQKRVPKLFLAGGLSPENVQDAIEAVNPYAVDACSSLESVPGKKDLARMTSFIERAHGG